MWTVYSSSDSDDGSPSPSAPERPPTDARKRPRLGSPSDGAAQAQRRRVPISRQGPVLNAAGWSQGAGVGAARRGTGLGAAGGGRAARRSRQRLPHAQTLESIPERALHLRREIARAAAVPASPDALEVRHGGPVRWGDVDAAEGRFLLSGAADGSVSVCDLGDFLPPQPSRSSARAARAWVHPEVLAVSAQRNRGWVHRAAVASVSWWPSDSGAFVTAGEDSCAALWDTAAGEAVCKFSLGSPGSSMTVAPDGSVVLVGCEDGSVRLCDPESGAAVASLGGQAGATKALAVLPLSPELVAVGTTAGCISIFDVRRLSPVASLDLSSPSPLAHGGTPFAGVEVPLGSRSLSAAAGDVSALVVADRRRAHVKSHAGGARAHEGGVTTITACLGGLFLLSAGLDDQIRLWVSPLARPWHDRDEQSPGDRAWRA